MNKFIFPNSEAKIKQEIKTLRLIINNTVDNDTKKLYLRQMEFLNAQLKELENENELER